jgi:hypothetical protein
VVTKPKILDPASSIERASRQRDVNRAADHPTRGLRATAPRLVLATMQARRLNPILNVSDVRASFACDMPWNVREMHVRHPDGHVFRISQGLE